VNLCQGNVVFGERARLLLSHNLKEER